MQILHGWAEHSRRYDHVADALTNEGYAVYADDHRGHGLTGAGAGGLGDLGPRGMAGVLDAVRTVTEFAVADSPGLPVFLLGHSWGSFLAQQYIRRWGDDLHGALLTGTTLRTGTGGGSRGSATTSDTEPQSPVERYAWLTRDTAEVQRYVDDPMCGFERMQTRPTAVQPVPDEAQLPGVPAGLPILVFNGADDRVGGAEGGKALTEHYREERVADVTLLTYPGARHELFNEMNRAEVITDVIAWLRARTPE